MDEAKITNLIERLRLVIDTKALSPFTLIWANEALGYLFSVRRNELDITSEDYENLLVQIEELESYTC